MRHKRNQAVGYKGAMGQGAQEGRHWGQMKTGTRDFTELGGVDK